MSDAKRSRPRVRDLPALHAKRDLQLVQRSARSATATTAR